MSEAKPERSMADKVAYVLLLVVSVAASFMIFGWTDKAKYSTGCTFLVLWLIWSAIGIFRLAREERSAATTQAHVDWLARGKAQIEVAGEPSRYLARFTGWQPPAVEQTGPRRMSAEERKVAKALRRLGLPYAEVSRLEDPAPEEDEEGAVVVEIPRFLI